MTHWRLPCDRRRGLQRLRMRNVVTPSSRRVSSITSPLCLSKLGISITASGSVHCTTRMSPGAHAVSAFRVRKTGRGHFSPRRSMSFSVIASWLWRGSQKPPSVPIIPAMSTRIIGLAGWSGSGKTTLVTKVIPVLTGRGLKVATVKHAHHEFDTDQPGKDSWLHRKAGACEVAIVSSRRWAIVHELGDEPEPPLGEVLAKLSAVDLVIVEGFKRHSHPKLEVFRATVGKPLLHPDDDCIVAVATDAPLSQALVPVLMLDDFDGIANVFEAEAVPLDQIGPPPDET